MERVRRLAIEPELKGYLPTDVAGLVGSYHETYGHRIAVAALDLLTEYTLIHHGYPRRPFLVISYANKVDDDDQHTMAISKTDREEWMVEDDEVVSYGTRQDVAERILRKAEIIIVMVNTMMDTTRSFGETTVKLYQNDPNEPTFDPRRV